MKPKPKVVIELYQRGAELKGRVLHMDERLRGEDELAKTMNWRLLSVYEPELSFAEKALYVRGISKTEDDRPLRQNFGTPKAATEAVVAIRALLDKVNGVKPKASKKWVKVI